MAKNILSTYATNSMYGTVLFANDCFSSTVVVVSYTGGKFDDVKKYFPPFLGLSSLETKRDKMDFCEKNWSTRGRAQHSNYWL